MVGWAGAAAAQQVVPVRTDGAIRVDGVLDEPVWQGAASITGLVQWLRSRAVRTGPKRWTSARDRFA
jgi:hypothetical protein